MNGLKRIPLSRLATLPIKGQTHHCGRFIVPKFEKSSNYEAIPPNGETPITQWVNLVPTLRFGNFIIGKQYMYAIAFPSYKHDNRIGKGRVRRSLTKKSLCIDLIDFVKTTFHRWFILVVLVREDGSFLSDEQAARLRSSFSLWWTNQRPIDELMSEMGRTQDEGMYERMSEWVSECRS